LTDEKTALLKQREETKKRKAAEAAQVADIQVNNCRKRKKSYQTERDPALDDDMEDRLRMGLAILIELAGVIHKSVQDSPFLATEPGCQDFCEGLTLKNTSLLISVPSKLEPYPGRTGVEKGWMGDKAMRFRKEQRGTVPAEGAAPAAERGAAPADSDGQASTPPSPVGAGGPSTRSTMPIDGKVRSLPGSFATENLNRLEGALSCLQQCS
jgi:hypothetical protein